MRSASALLLLSALFAGCALGADRRPETTPAERARRVGAERMRAAQEAALLEGDAIEPLTFGMRLNPTPSCDAPPFEVRARGRWTRVLMEADAATLERLRRAPPEKLVGTLIESGSADERGVVWPLFVVSASQEDALASP